ncbi:MAG: 4'-phosphopantetheinyl transferase superfamily protein [Chitinophagales bacterium]
MPLYYAHNTENYRLAIWRISEDAEFFSPALTAPEITHEKKQLQWLATRHLVNELTGHPCEVLKDAYGKPYLKDSAQKVSITHTALFAGVLLSDKQQVGMDLEMITPKVERIAHKFLYPEELAAIKADEKIEKLILYWSAKEALYKLHGRRQLEFKSQLLIEPFELQLKGTLSAAIKASDMNVKGLSLHYEFFEDHVVTWVAL